MAGTDPRFDADKFKTGILFAQTMGLPPAEEDQPLFFPRDTRSYVDVDAENKPWDPRDPGDDVPGGAGPDGVLAVCAMKVLEVQARPQESAAGQISPIRMQLIFLPDEWAKVSDFHKVRIGGVMYERGKMLPPSGLFSVAMTSVEIRAGESK